MDSDAKDRLVKKIPSFAEAVADCKKQNTALATNLESFAGDEKLLYHACWYAISEGVAITFVPEKSLLLKP